KSTSWPQTLARKSIAVSFSGAEDSTYQLEPPRLEALTEASMSPRRGIGATAHMPDWSGLALIVAVIHTPVGVANVSPEVKRPVYSVQPSNCLVKSTVSRR